MTRALALVFFAAVTGAACSHTWDDYDPRLGDGGGAQTGTGAGTPTSSATTAAGDPAASSSSGDGGSGDGGGPTVTTGGGSTSESSSSGTPTETLEIVAIQADCTDPADPDADDCDDEAAPASFTIDADAAPFNQEWIGYLRFSPGGELAGKTIESVRLRMFVADVAQADADDSGVIWRAEPFDRDDLDDGAPEFLGDEPVGASIGPVARDQQVTFEIVGLTVQADTPIYLAVDTNSIDGVDYLDERSATPPTLVVTYH